GNYSATTGSPAENPAKSGAVRDHRDSSQSARFARPPQIVLPVHADSCKVNLTMTRIFVTLATADFLALVVTFALGWWSKATDGLHAATGSLYVLHFLCGLFTAVGTLLTHCLIFTYFLGTGRWVKEVTLAYDL